MEWTVTRSIKSCRKFWNGPELTAFRESPLKTLSTGMKARLAFSATRHFQTDIYLLDEVLAAGDKNFKAKCETVFEEYKKSDKTFVISTHDLKFVRKLL